MTTICRHCLAEFENKSKDTNTCPTCRKNKHEDASPCSKCVEDNWWRQSELQRKAWLEG